MSKDPGKLSVMKPLRAEIDAELAQAISSEDATARGLEESGDCYPVRIWNNCIAAIKAKNKSGDGAALVWKRDKKDVQVWVRAKAAQTDHLVANEDMGRMQEQVEQSAQ